MGIHLSKTQRELLGSVAGCKRDHASVYPLLYGYLQSYVESYLRNLVPWGSLEDAYAFCELMKSLSLNLTPDEIDEIACGTRELPGEDVHNGQ